MTLLGVGAGGGDYAAPANTSLGSIGLGYIYTDWLAQIDYTTPDLSRLQAHGRPVRSSRTRADRRLRAQPISTPESLAGLPRARPFIDSATNLYFSATCLLPEARKGSRSAGDFDSWAIRCRRQSSRSRVLGVPGWYYYNGKGVGTTALFFNASDGLGSERKSDGFLAQATSTARPDEARPELRAEQPRPRERRDPNPTLVEEEQQSSPSGSTTT